ncbi:flagellar hook-basal body complex protein FliE [Sphingomonas sp. A2-49]|uniref:flagellar hook-basal body complex protein FliE n=1 Tax=Sphingomonas sp. A2-49 TaxID=1391375 RepID=UPI0021CE7278|nr:flagellar hook-basal body complex protein FliE [Sphingomonas sp. A2-49]MCU6453335.1 flagellar hook-basal body complex protein FliE [Sphingomonas sp. A2-49]
MNVNGVADVLALRNAVLQRNAALRDVASAPAPTSLRGPSNVATPPSSFAATMQDALQKVNAIQEQEDVATEAYERGDTTDIATVALMQQRASVSFEATLQVRNKVLSAYKDIMSMAI